MCAWGLHQRPHSSAAKISRSCGWAASGWDVGPGLGTMPLSLLQTRAGSSPEIRHRAHPHSPPGAYTPECAAAHTQPHTHQIQRGHPGPRHTASQTCGLHTRTISGQGGSLPPAQSKNSFPMGQPPPHLPKGCCSGDPQAQGSGAPPGLVRRWGAGGVSTSRRGSERICRTLSFPSLAGLETHLAHGHKGGIYPYGGPGPRTGAS